MLQLFRMAAFFLRRLALQPIKTEYNFIGRCFGNYLLQEQLALVVLGQRLCGVTHTKAFSTVEGTKDESTKKKKNEAAFSNIGRKIHERIIHVFDEKGNDLGDMHRADVIRLLNERDLRLVKRNTTAEIPEYQLMTGAQIHEERLRLRGMEKANPKTGPILTKELSFSSTIGQHDLDTKSKQIQQWIEKKYKVQITVKKGKNAEEPENKMEEIFKQILQTMPGIATFGSRPQPARGGKAVMCVLRPLSKKEEKAYREMQETQSGDTSNKEPGINREPDVLHQQF